MTNLLSDYSRKEIGNCTLYFGDCLDIIPLLGLVNCVLTDPPYGLGFDAKKGWDKKPHTQWVMPSVDRLVQEGNILCFASKNYSFQIESVLRKSCFFQNRLIWLKNAAGFQYSGRQPRTQHEDIIWFSKTEKYYFDLYGQGLPADWVKKDRNPGKSQNGIRTATTVLKGKVKPSMKIEDRTTHPTQKPVSVVSDLMNIFVKKGDLVLDPFMGSGTSGIAAIKTGRHFIGIEKDREYFEMSCNRIQQAYNQPDLFV